MKQVSIRIPAEIGLQSELLDKYIANNYFTTQYEILKRSVDARGKIIQTELIINLYFKEQIPSLNFAYPISALAPQKRIIIIGSGPAGLFAALHCISLGIKPIILERGNNVQGRRRDLANINRFNIVNPDSNYCFGEGGAGTYSDGKLYTRSTKRGDVESILRILVEHGATPEILFDAHPHIGTNKLPKVVESIRNKILQSGGEIHFNTLVTGLILKGVTLKGVITTADEYQGDAVIMATGHSARDIYEILNKADVEIQAKPFAMGVRVEHPQQLIDDNLYRLRGHSRPDYLPAAAYKLVTQTHHNNQARGVYSFCMCPGGFIVAAATQQNELVVNGMSPSRRDSKYANSGYVVAIEPTDWEHHTAEYGVFAGLKLQSEFEQTMWRSSGETQTASAQKIGDFIHCKLSESLPSTSYIPGIVSRNFNEILPAGMADRFKAGFKEFGKKIDGFDSNQGIMVGAESRTSSPIRIPRQNDTFEHIRIQRLYPCGEGAGYAGGIVSAAIDGVNCAEKAVFKYCI
ncbi:MAG: NAD(P)/FAD-dependent oxidoreductase [Bacteroidota bacterium]|nr:NAD(P)/FAD-dependent oxidoreductase [Bacteroidota bacterium]